MSAESFQCTPLGMIVSLAELSDSAKPQAQVLSVDFLSCSFGGTLPSATADECTNTILITLPNVTRYYRCHIAIIISSSGWRQLLWMASASLDGVSSLEGVSSSGWRQLLWMLSAALGGGAKL
jgi:hypothetical protein